ncbi:MAG: DUF3298 domain-containing protein, partial [Clostridia bacterium]|nr:DUF3298 domain-containing protein [Clostridia bacterium]
MKRKSVCWFLCFALCFCFASCQRTRRQEEGAPPAPADEARLGTDSSVTPLGVCVFSESEQKRSKSFHKVIARLAYPVVGLAEEDAARYPALAQALNGLNGQIAGSAKARYAAVAEAAAADIGAAPDSFTEYESTTRLFVRRADTRILSLLYESYTFAGGGDGSRIWSAISFDAASGRELSLAGLVPDISALSSVVRELLLKHYPKTKFYELAELDSRFGEGDGDFCWLADDAGLTFVFNPNDIAPAADGSIAVTVPYGALSGAVSAEYAALPGASAVALPPELPYFGDLDGDGETDRLTVSCEKDEYGAYYDMLCVSFNDGKTLEDTLACGVDALLF